MNDMNATSARRSGAAIMGRLIVLVKPLVPIMVLAILLGSVGYLCAIFITILAAFGISAGLEGAFAGASFSSEALVDMPVAGPVGIPVLFVALAVMAVARGLLHYGEQYCNHFIAFRLLAIVRHRVFAVLRTLCPAKLEGRDKGDLVSLITSDIELLEVFYAHTISPIAIAVIVSACMAAFISTQSAAVSLVALAGYTVVGVLIPIAHGRRGAQVGFAFRESFARMNGFILESLHGLDETIQYGQGTVRGRAIDERSRALGRLQEGLAGIEASQRSMTNAAIQLFSVLALAVSVFQFGIGSIGFTAMIVSTVAVMGSFGPVVALASLSNNLNQTLAAGERVLALLDEKPQVEDIEGEQPASFHGMVADDVSFAYADDEILSGMSFDIPKGAVVGIHGQSGSGKSTLLKLMMRFWDVTGGSLSVRQVSGPARDLRHVNTTDLRSCESYVTQETWLFHDTIARNIEVGRPGASREDIVAAAKAASIHDFIETLPDGYDTNVGELGDTLSGGERQRIGIARAFLHDAPLMLLDEPTSNLDALNEGVILKSLRDQAGERTIVLVSHRASTLAFADTVMEMESGRAS